jgi:hypothetical protein
MSPLTLPEYTSPAHHALSCFVYSTMQSAMQIIRRKAARGLCGERRGLSLLPLLHMLHMLHMLHVRLLRRLFVVT